MSNPNELQAQIIQAGGAQILLPNAIVVEILRQAQTEPQADAPAWLVGTFHWQGQEVPLVSFGRFSGLDEDLGAAQDTAHKCVVLKTVSAASGLPCFALKTDQFPHFVDIQRHGLLLDASDDRIINGVRMTVLVGGKSVVLPDLDAIERGLAHWLGR
jgi:chemosensory pili system protein ChpC